MIAVCTPTRDTIQGSTTFDLVNLCRVSKEAIFTVSFGSLLSNVRLLLAKTAMDNKCSHVLFIDSDMRFPQDSLKRLLSRRQDIIGANCKQRTQDAWTARRKGEFVSSATKEGIEEVDILGFGVTLISAKVFHSLEQPWFGNPFDGTKLLGEDVYFCTKAKEAGYKIYADHDLSHEVKHIGAVEL